MPFNGDNRSAVGGGQFNGGAQGGRELALLLNALQNGFAAVFEFAQIAQPGVEFAQLNIIKPAGRFLAVARNKWHGRAAIEQLHRSLDLMRLGLDFRGNLVDYFLHVGEK